jgi:GAF domain-containing protein
VYLRNARIDRAQARLESIDRQLKLASLTSQLAQQITRETALDDVLNTTIDTLRASFPQIYHTQIFLLDDMLTTARLVASTGDVGRQLLERAHSLPVGSQSVVGTVTVSGEPLLALAGARDGIHRPNPLLPDTAVEAAFPLRLGNRVIGVLDVQSKEANAFTADDLPLFQSLADSIALAINNARLFGDQARQIAENRALAERAEAATREVERLNRDVTSDAWSRYLAELDNSAIEIDFATGERRLNPAVSSAQQAAFRSQSIYRQTSESGTTLSIPLVVRGLTVGALDFDLPGALTEEDEALIRGVSERLTLALETTRLSVQTRRTAQREALVNALGTRLQTAHDIETLLQEAARGLQTAVSARRVAIRLGTPDAARSNGGTAR